MGRHDLLKILKGRQGPGHALRGQLPGGGQPLPQTGDLAAVDQDPKSAAGEGLGHRQAHGQAAQSRAAKFCE